MMKKAFTIIEALIAIVIAGLLIGYISRMQVGAIRRFGRWKEEIKRVFPIKSKMLEHYLIIPKKLKLVDVLDDWKITTEINEITSKSSLKDFRKMIRIMKATGEWRDKDMTLVTFVLAEVKDE